MTDPYVEVFDGVRITTTNKSSRRRVAGERQREVETPRPPHAVGWTQARRQLMAEILGRSQSVNRSWTSIEGYAGAGRLIDLREAAEALMLNGAARIHERLDRGEWVPKRLELIDLGLARRIVGLPDLDAIEAEAKRALCYEPASAFTRELLESAAAARRVLVPRRVKLIEALDAWMEGGKQGTRRDFSLFATGNTKQITASDWAWLDGLNALEQAGIVDHEPILLLGGTFAIHGGGLELAATGAGPFGIPRIGLTDTLIVSVERWVVFENRTVMDRACRINSRAGLIWVPGYAPGWWLSMVERLVAAAPVPMTIACDPDPAGIEIALRASTSWRTHGIAWSVAGMGRAALEELRAPRPKLSEADKAVLERAAPFIAGTPLERCAADIADLGEKGEQEGYWTDERLVEWLQERH